MLKDTAQNFISTQVDNPTIKKWLIRLIYYIMPHERFTKPHHIVRKKQQLIYTFGQKINIFIISRNYMACHFIWYVRGDINYYDFA